MAADRLQEFYETMNKGIFEGRGKAPELPSHHELVMKSIKSCLDLRKYTEDLKVRLIENRTSVDFVLSDDPAIYNNRYAMQKLGNGGFGMASSGVTFTLPLTPRFALICYDGTVYTVPDLIGGRCVVKNISEVEALNEWQYLNCAENIYFKQWEHGAYVRERFLAQKDNQQKRSTTLTRFVRKGGDANTHVFQEGTAHEAGRVRGPSLIKLSHTYATPTHWFAPLKFRPKPKTFSFGSSELGHVRKKEWLTVPAARSSRIY